jgi:hypothetical protein
VDLRVRADVIEEVLETRVLDRFRRLRGLLVETDAARDVTKLSELASRRSRIECSAAKTSPHEPKLSC